MCLTNNDLWLPIWSLSRQLMNKWKIAQRALEKKILNLKLQDRTQCLEIRKRMNITDIIEYTLKQIGNGLDI